MLVTQKEMYRPTPHAHLSLLRRTETWDISKNNFISTIDSDIGKLQNLTHLMVDENSFSGPIPSSVTGLTNLQHVVLADNPNLVGPLFNYSTNWSRLQYLDISATGFTGTLPTEIGWLGQLTQLAFYDVPITGSTIPSEVGLLSSMRTLRHFAILFLPSGVGEAITLCAHCLILPCLLNRAEYFEAGKEVLGGTLPSELGLWKDIGYFALRDTAITGTIPSEIGAWDKV